MNIACPPPTSDESGWQKYSSSICSNSRVLKVKFWGDISLRNDFPTCPMPMGTRMHECVYVCASTHTMTTHQHVRAFECRIAYAPKRHSNTVLSYTQHSLKGTHHAPQTSQHTALRTHRTCHTARVTPHPAPHTALTEWELFSARPHDLREVQEDALRRLRSQVRVLREAARMHECVRVSVCAGVGTCTIINNINECKSDERLCGRKGSVPFNHPSPHPPIHSTIRPSIHPTITLSCPSPTTSLSFHVYTGECVSVRISVVVSVVVRMGVCMRAC